MNYDSTISYWNTVFAQTSGFDPLLPLAQAEIEDGLAWLVKEKPTLLDFGCGRGRLLLRAAALGAAGGLGIDLSEKAVEQASKAAAEGGLASRVRFSTGGLDLLDSLPAQGFGGGILFNLLDNLLPSDASTVLGHFRRLLAPGSRLLVKLNPYFDPAELVGQAGMKIIADEVFLEPSGLYFWNLSDAQAESLLSGSFQLLRKETVHYSEVNQTNRLYYLQVRRES